MSDDTRKQILRDLAMDNALTLYKGQAVSAEELLKTAEMIRLYRDGSIHVGLNLLDSDANGRGLPVNDCNSIAENGGDVVSVTADVAAYVQVNDLPFGCGDAVCNTRDQVFSGHTNSSSVGVDNSASGVATPARTKIIIPWQRLECMEGTGDGIVIVLKGAVA